MYVLKLLGHGLVKFFELADRLLTWRLGSLFGAEIVLNCWLNALLTYAFVVSLELGLTLTAVFLCVLLHELGHVWVARRCGFACRKVELSPLGGMASVDVDPDRPAAEFAVAAAGPAVSLFLAGLYAVAWRATGYDAARHMALLNLFLVGFNLLPAFPADGGRMFRAVLAVYRTDLVWRTRVTFAITCPAAALTLAFGLYYLQPVAVLVGLITPLATASECRRVSKPKEE